MGLKPNLRELNPEGAFRGKHPVLSAVAHHEGIPDGLVIRRSIKDERCLVGTRVEVQGCFG